MRKKKKIPVGLGLQSIAEHMTGFEKPWFFFFVSPEDALPAWAIVCSAQTGICPRSCPNRCRSVGAQTKGTRRQRRFLHFESVPFDVGARRCPTAHRTRVFKGRTQKKKPARKVSQKGSGALGLDVRRWLGGWPAVHAGPRLTPASARGGPERGSRARIKTRPRIARFISITVLQFLHCMPEE